MLEEEIGRVGTSHSMMANRNDLGFAVEFTQRLGKRCQRDERRPVQLGQIEFPLFSDVQEDELFAFIEPAFQFGGSDGVTHDRLRFFLFEAS